MAMYNYGIGGNEVKVDANEAIAEIPSNRTLFVQKLTNEAPVAPEAVYDLKTIEEVFEKFKPKLDLEFTDSEGSETKESVQFKNLGDFGPKAIKQNSEFLSKLDIEKDQYTKISRQLASNRALKKALENPESRNEIIKMLEASLQEINQTK